MMVNSVRWGPHQVITTLWSKGPWWLCAQKLDTGAMRFVFYGIKIGPLAVYVRWNTPGPLRGEA